MKNSVLCSEPPSCLRTLVRVGDGGLAKVENASLVSCAVLALETRR